MDSITAREQAEFHQVNLIVLSAAYVAKHGVIPDTKILNDFESLLHQIVDRKHKHYEAIMKENGNANRERDKDQRRD